MIHHGDCIEVMAGMPADSVDAICTDPPYGIEFMGKKWDAAKPAGFDKRTRDTAGAVDGAYARLLDRGPIQYIAGTPFQAWCEAWGREALRVTKPGGYLLAFGGTRTHHRLVCGLEDAGWIIRDELDWIYASGFPKGKANLKPAHEPIVLARKPGPLRPLAIDECRIDYTSEADRPTQEEWNRAGSSGAPGANGYAGQFSKGMKDAYADGKIPVPSGRWPSNLLLSDPELFDEPNPYVVGSGATAVSGSRTGEYASGGFLNGSGPVTAELVGDSGGYSRFFVIPKSSRSDREPTIYPDGHDRSKRFSTHPTQKPTDLMAHLIKLVTPIDGVILDPFLGSGSTAVAAERLGVKWIGIEKEAEYVAIAEARLNGVQRGLGLDVPAPTRKVITPSDEKMPPWAWKDRTVGSAGERSWFHKSDDEEPAA